MSNPKKFIRTAIISVVVFVCLVFANSVFADNPLDSLNQELGKAIGEKKIAVLNQLTRALWASKPEKALQFAQEAYALAEAINNREQMALALKNAGIVHYFMGENTEAIDLYTRSMVIFTQLNHQKGVSDCLNNLGLIYTDLCDYKKALNYYEQSLKIDIQRNNQQEQASTMSNMGAIYHLQGMYSKAMGYYLHSLWIEYKFKNNEGVGECLLNMGALYQETQNYAKGFKCYEAAMILFIKENNQNRIALTNHNLGMLYYSVNNNLKALNYTRTALTLRTQLSDQQGVASSCFLLANILDALKDTNQSNEYFFKAINLEMKLGNQKKVASALQDKADKLLKKGYFNIAIPYYLNSMEIARDINARPELLYSYERLSAAYYALHDAEMAMVYNRKYLLLSDSIMKDSKGLIPVENIMQTTSYETMMQNDFPQNNANKLIEKNDNTFYFIILGWGITLIILCVLSILYILQRRKHAKFLKEINKITNQK
ncbi:MAG: tetratricopeptide repeat protein [Bacteroidota bacterium]